MGEVKRGFERKWVVFSIIIGVFLGFAILLAGQEALHATDTGKFCSNCHVMNEAHDSYTRNVHASVNCNDCHIPQDNWFNKYTFKAKAGITDVYYNTLGKKDIPNVIHPNSGTQKVVNENCMNCHKTTISGVEHDSKEKCISCHRGMPHGKGSFKTKDFYEEKQYEVFKVE